MSPVVVVVGCRSGHLAWITVCRLATLPTGGGTLTFVLHAVRVAVVSLVVRRRRGRINGGSAGAILAMAAISRSLLFFYHAGWDKRGRKYLLCCHPAVGVEPVAPPKKYKRLLMVLLMV